MSFLHSIILPEICRQNNYNLIKISNECTKIIKDNKETIVYYFDFNCNPNANSWIARDKPTAYNFLITHNIPAVEHVYLPYCQAADLAQKYLSLHQNVVLKSTHGTCGQNVHFCNSNSSLNQILFKLMKKGSTICISPFETYDEEYRVIVCNNKAKICYAKVRPFIIGDGKSTIKQLKTLKYPNLNTQNLNENQILKDGVKKNLIWKHNLCNGAQISEIKNKVLKNTLNNIATSTSKALGLKICSVDIIYSNNCFKVLEVNPGLMMESFYNSNPTNKIKTINLYKRVINLSLKHSTQSRVEKIIPKNS